MVERGEVGDGKWVGGVASEVRTCETGRETVDMYGFCSRRGTRRVLLVVVLGRLGLLVIGTLKRICCGRGGRVGADDGGNADEFDAGGGGVGI